MSTLDSYRSSFAKTSEDKKGGEFMKVLHYIAVALLVIGGLNWGLIGLMNYNLVTAVFGSMPGLEQIVYILVGLSAVFVAATHMTDCKECKMKK